MATVHRQFTSFPIADLQQTKLQMLSWLNRFNICCFLDNQQYTLPHQSIECLAAAGALHTLKVNAGNAFHEFELFHQQHNDWLFGHLGYDLKNESEQLTSHHPDAIGFPDLCFFVPEIVLQLQNGELQIGSVHDDAQQIFNDICNSQPAAAHAGKLSATIHHRIPREEYLRIIQQIQQHILRGDCYEINFCQEFFAENISIDPLRVYRALSEASPNPFAAYYKIDDKHLLCASPERYLKKEGNKIYSQPIKGTSKRNLHNSSDDVKNKEGLFNSAKDRTENVMIVDLVRNDLSKICNDVKVDELFGIYSFPQVHQMISTVSGELNTGIVDALKATFPMGSMTGAPKKRVMQLIEQYERTRRGIFSGAVGYITPGGDFDFNVVIRSIMYNASTRYLSFQAGSAITYSSDPEQEYNECLLKAAAIYKVLTKMPHQ